MDLVPVTAAERPPLLRTIAARALRTAVSASLDLLLLVPTGGRSLRPPR